MSLVSIGARVTAPDPDRTQGDDHSVLSAVIERSNDVAIVIGPTGLITSWNDAAEALYGFPSHEVLGLPLTDLAPEEGAQASMSAILTAACGGRVEGMTVSRRHRDGSLFEITVDLEPVILTAPADRAHRGHRRETGALGESFPARELQHLLERTPGIVLRFAPDGTITYAAGDGWPSPGLGLGLGSGLAADASVVGANFVDLCVDDSTVALAAGIVSGTAFTGTCSIGGSMWRVSCRPIILGTEGFVGSAGFLCPVEAATSDNDRTHAFARSEARARALAAHSSDLVMVVEANLTVTYVSRSVERLLGLDPVAMLGHPVTDFIHRDDVLAARARLATAQHTDRPPSPFELRLGHANIGWYEYEVVGTNLTHDPAVRGIIINGRDVTERSDSDRKLRHASLHDPLTDLPNRTLLLQEMDALQISTGPSGLVAVVVIGLDRFKLVNDSMGHASGDQLLVTVAERLRRAVRRGDIVARLGGDTFAVATNQFEGPSEGRHLAERLLAVLTDPVDLDSRKIAVTACAGVAFSAPDDDGPALVRNGESALYLAKGQGRSCFEVFEAATKGRAATRLDLEQALHHAAEAGELRVFFQPIIALDDTSTIGVEALVRWQHPEFGLVPPNDFIPMAEDTGDIVAIGTWVLRESCRTLARWAADGIDLHLSVNLSARQLLESDFPLTVSQILAETGVPAANLTMEVTETVLVDDNPFATGALERLRAMGIHLAIDDFGTGYSSLVYLRRLHFDSLKIDRSFVNGLGVDTEDDVIIRTVIDLAQSLGLNVVAEGVETESQHALLCGLGCQSAQGFLFSKPLPSDQFEAWHRVWHHPERLIVPPPKELASPTVEPSDV
jgi:diguanylate cyclase (GGDEF)-like protein/PAS domain S-box-containing protein